MSKKTTFQSVLCRLVIYLYENSAAQQKSGIAKSICCVQYHPSYFFCIVSGDVLFVVLAGMSDQLIHFMLVYVVTTWVDFVFVQQR